MDASSLVLSVAGLTVGLAGLGVGYFQGRGAVRLRKVTQQGLLEALTQVDSLLLSQEDVVELSTDNGQVDAGKVARLTEERRGLDDLYGRLVHQYLAGERDFTLEHLTVLELDGVVTQTSTVRVWRKALSRRDENRKLGRRFRRQRQVSKKVSGRNLPLPKRSHGKVGP